MFAALLRKPMHTVDKSNWILTAIILDDAGDTSWLVAHTSNDFLAFTLLALHPGKYLDHVSADRLTCWWTHCRFRLIVNSVLPCRSITFLSLHCCNFAIQSNVLLKMFACYECFHVSINRTGREYEKCPVYSGLRFIGAQLQPRSRGLSPEYRRIYTGFRLKCVRFLKTHLYVQNDI